MIVLACPAKTQVEAEVKGKRIQGLAALTPEQLSFYGALEVPKPQYRDMNAV